MTPNILFISDLVNTRFIRGKNHPIEKSSYLAFIKYLLKYLDCPIGGLQ